MKKHLANLAAKSAVVGFLALSLAVPIHAGIPVFDGVNISQSIMTAMENIAQTAKQIEQYEKQVQQYKTQLDQYENMLKNTARPVTEIWDQAQSTMNALRSAVDTLNRYKQQLGSLDAYLSKFQDIDYYKSSPCLHVDRL
jgi:P-type conjugative transfer protein TrbJ